LFFLFLLFSFLIAYLCDDRGSEYQHSSGFLYHRQASQGFSPLHFTLRRRHEVQARGVDPLRLSRSLLLFCFGLRRTCSLFSAALNARNMAGKDPPMRPRMVEVQVWRCATDRRTDNDPRYFYPKDNERVSMRLAKGTSHNSRVFWIAHVEIHDACQRKPGS
jgi:hypothetical protein